MIPSKTLILTLLLLTPASIGATSHRENWMGAYLNHSKIGHSVLVLEPTERFPSEIKGKLATPEGADEPGGKQLFAESEIGIKAYGKRKPLAWMVSAALKADFSLSRLAFRMESDDSRTDIRARVTTRGLEVEVESSGDTRHQVLPLELGRVYLAEALPARLAALLSEGQDIEGEYPVFEPHQLSVAEWGVRLEGTELLDVGGRSLTTYRVEQDTGGFKPLTWFDSSGWVWKEWAPLGERVGYLSFSESREQALNLDYVHPDVSLGATVEGERDPDLMYSTSVEAGRAISDPGAVRRMVVDLYEFDLERPFPFDEYQRKLPGNPSQTPDRPSAFRLEVIQATPPVETSGARLPSDLPAKLRHHLEPEAMVQVGHADIQARAAEIVRGISDPWDKALAIHAWMGKNIRTEFRITMPSAIEVLHTAKGDCNEQAHLFAALARAAGVPARIVSGLVYQRGAFYYHAWNEVLVGVAPERWIPMDATLRQTIADATHIKFGEGGVSEQSYITGLIGKIRATILEIETDDPDQATHPAIRPDNRG